MIVRPVRLALCAALAAASALDPRPLAAATPGAASTHAKPRPALSAEDWREDLRFLVKTMKETHPKLFWRVGQDTLEAAVAELDRGIPSMSEDEIVTGIVRIAAMPRDGHTFAMPWAGPVATGTVFPVRLYRFSDGLFVTAAHRSHADLAGAKVERIGGVPADQALNRVSDLLGYDNSYTRLERGPMALAMPILAHGSGLASSRESIELSVVTRKGSRKTVRVAAIPEPNHGAWLRDRSLAPEGFATAAPGSAARPRSWPRASNYWFELLPGTKTVYVQFNEVNHAREEPFGAFCQRLWTFVDERDVDRLVLDIRNNQGGNNGILKPLYHGVIKRDRINRRGHFITILGRGTYSAAMNCAAFLEEQTNVLFTGEPSGAAPCQAGDAGQFTLPRSGMPFQVSRYLWLNTVPWDNRPWIRPHVPALTSSKDYFAGKDPALETALSMSSFKPLPERMREAWEAGGAAAARSELNAHRKSYPDVPGMSSEGDVNRFGYELLAHDRVDDAIEVFRWNTEDHPGSWNAWDSLGEALVKKGDRERAIAAYRKSVELNPESQGGKEALRHLTGS
ncbi:MAG TPA: tetratricopeptide repeat protein [Candidatus Eisenbacteria bacterium]|nr:tetratricopeptide repeat protein [Candidatus Eisenbacteria bacterium]